MAGGLGEMSAVQHHKGLYKWGKSKDGSDK